YIEILNRLEATLTGPIPASEVQFRLGEEYFHAQQNEEAADRFEASILLNPSSPSAKSAKQNLHEIRHLAIGQIAPEYEVATLLGDVLTLSDLRGHPVLLEFWATWCGPCIAEIPNLRKLGDEYPQLRIVG